MMPRTKIQPIDRVNAVPRSTPGRARRALANMIAALTVNAAIILAIPRSTATTPVPVVLQRNRPLIDGCWEEGEFVGGRIAMVATVARHDSHQEHRSSEWITLN